MSHKHNSTHGHKPDLTAAPMQLNVLPFKKEEICLHPSRDEISRRAYFNYLNEGSKPGNDLFHWLEAEADLLAGCNRLNADEANAVL